MNAAGRPQLLFHVQHFFGMGHLVRAISLAEGLSRYFDVHIVSGGGLPDTVEVPAGVDVTALPQLGMDLDAQLVSLVDGRSVGEVLARRRRVVLDVYEHLEPDVVLVELFPFGRKKLGEELIPLLERASNDPRRPLIATSVRDILVTGRRNQAGHDARAATVAEKYLDIVVCHGDERFVPFSDSFRPSRPITTAIVHTGFVARRGVGLVPRGVIPDSVVVSAGGGWVGEALMRAALSAQPRLWFELGVPMTLITGPLSDGDTFEELAAVSEKRPGIAVVRSVPDLSAALGVAAASISQCGYNTTLDLLRTGVPAVVVPFGTARENEQPRRAELLQAHGLATVIDPAQATGESLADAVKAVLGARPPRPGWSIDGADRTGRILTEALRQKRRRPVTPVLDGRGSETT